MEDRELASYLRSLRKRAGLSQRDLADLLGYPGDGQVSKHERAVSMPSLLVAFGYSAVFRVPVAELFPGIYETVRRGIDGRLRELEIELLQSTAKGRKAQVIARRVEWLWEREHPETTIPG
jgi:transcriptional regulator with XRE-family HTH domain